jgi:hypothetical protein
MSIAKSSSPAASSDGMVVRSIFDCDDRIGGN